MSAQPSASIAASIATSADELEERAILALSKVVIAKSSIYTSGERDPTVPPPRVALGAGQGYLMGDDPRMPKMPERPTLLDFFKYRMPPAMHLLQSATHALKGGHNEKIILACLLHDVAITGFIRVDHGYWGAQLIEPYVDEEVSWAIRAHQALRFYADESVGYKYPQQYIDWFGADYQPEPYVQAAYQAARNHKWYMTARQITVNDIYSFDPNAKVSMDDFVDIIGRNFRQPKEGLGFDGSPVAHMWRTMIWPTKFL
jgi:hypothetical protein